jgi:hypothetical protein
MTWDYGEEGAAIAVQRGQLWRCGQHTFFCGTLLSLSRVNASLFYCDPPWNNAITSTFRNNAGYGEEAGATWQAVYAGIIGLSRGLPLFVEGGEKQAGEVQAMLRHHPADHVRQWPITYARASRPCVLHYAGPVECPGDPTGMDDADTPGWAMGLFPAGRLVADLTAGRGITSRCAEEQGWASFNVELDGRRVSAALVRLAKMTRDTPRLVRADASEVTVR